MKLSEAARKGYEKFPNQAYGDYIQVNDGVVCLCFAGCAYAGMKGVLPIALSTGQTGDIIVQQDAIEALEGADTYIPVPDELRITEGYFNFDEEEGKLGALAVGVQLNDTLEWPVPKICDYLEQFGV